MGAEAPTSTYGGVSLSQVQKIWLEVAGPFCAVLLVRPGLLLRFFLNNRCPHRWSEECRRGVRDKLIRTDANSTWTGLPAYLRKQSAGFF
jgi:hypothetical protein